MMLSPHFSLDELVLSQAAARGGLDNTPNANARENLGRLAYRLEVIRHILDAPVIVTSGYRSLEVNERVGGSAHSAHLIGLAADIVAPRFGTPRDVFECLKLTYHAENVNYDQLILEFGTWVHVGFTSLSRVPRQQVLETVASR